MCERFTRSDCALRRVHNLSRPRCTSVLLKASSVKVVFTLPINIFTQDKVNIGTSVAEIVIYLDLLIVTLLL